MNKYYCDECESTGEPVRWETEHEYGPHIALHCPYCGAELKHYHEIEEPARRRQAMRVKIVRCSKRLAWYSSWIGCEMSVIDDPNEPDDYLVWGVIYGGWPILKSDCEIIPEQEARSDDRH